MAIEIKISGIGKNSCVNLKGIDGSIHTFTDKTKSIKVIDATVYTQSIEALKGMGFKIELKPVAERVRGNDDGNKTDKTGAADETNDDGSGKNKAA